MAGSHVFSILDINVLWLFTCIVACTPIFSGKDRYFMRRYRHLLVALSLAVVMITVFASAVQADAGFLTSRPAQVRALIPSAKIDPILTVGDTLPNGYTMAAIPDGMGAFDNGDGTFTLMMNHD
jgi:hypothetical protein